MFYLFWLMMYFILALIHELYMLGGDIMFMCFFMFLVSHMVH